MEYQKPFTTYHALAHDVLVVASAGRADDWAAYVGAVPGKSHKSEWRAVAAEGAKLSKELATAMWPQFDPAKYRL